MNCRRALSLKVKTGLIFGGILAALLCLLALVSHYVTSGFASLQIEYATQRLGLIVHHIDHVAQRMVHSVADYAIWDETHAFTMGSHPTYFAKNFYELPTRPSSADVILVLSPALGLLGATTVQAGNYHAGLPAGFSVKDITALPFTMEGSGSVEPVNTRLGPMLVAAHPIYPSDFTGEPTGILVYAAFFRGELPEVCELTGVARIMMQSPPVPPVPGEVVVPLGTRTLPDVTARFRDPAASWFSPPPESATINIGARNGGVIQLAVQLTNEILDQALRSQRTILLCAIVGGIGLVVLACVLIDRFVLRRITSLSNEITRLAALDFPPDRLDISGNDEFTGLAMATNQLLSSIESRNRMFQHEHALFVSVLNATAEAVIAATAVRGQSEVIRDFKIIRVNAAAAAMLGTPAEILRERSLSGSIPELDAPAPWAFLVKAVDQDRPFSLEIEGVGDRAGRSFALSVTKWEDGVVISLSDTTRSRLVEAEIRGSLVDTERFNRAMVDREERILELKREINSLLADLDRPPVYGLEERQ